MVCVNANPGGKLRVEDMAIGQVKLRTVAAETLKSGRNWNVREG